MSLLQTMFLSHLWTWALGTTHKGTISMHPQSQPVLCSIHKPANRFQFFFSSTSLLFHLYLCNFTQICFGFLKKTLWFFPMVFGEKPTPSISEVTSIQRLLYIKTKGPKIDPKWPYSFTNFAIPLPATYIRHSRDKCWNLLLKFECH